jgi:hypothetical protein
MPTALRCRASCKVGLSVNSPQRGHGPGKLRTIPFLGSSRKLTQIELERRDPKPHKGKTQEKIEDDEEPEGDGAFGAINPPTIPDACLAPDYPPRNNDEKG